jgi:hypothetical protein
MARVVREQTKGPLNSFAMDFSDCQYTRLREMYTWACTHTVEVVEMFALLSDGLLGFAVLVRLVTKFPFKLGSEHKLAGAEKRRVLSSMDFPSDIRRF